jgi:hypothetical protein
VHSSSGQGQAQACNCCTATMRASRLGETGGQGRTSALIHEQLPVEEVGAAHDVIVAARTCSRGRKRNISSGLPTSPPQSHSIFNSNKHYITPPPSRVRRA